MPTSRRTSAMRLTSLPSEMPSTTTSPRWNGSSPLMQRSTVDLPEPDGPQITMRSPRRTVRLTSRSTLNSPNHLYRPRISTATSPPARLGATVSGLSSATVMRIPLAHVPAKRAPDLIRGMPVRR